MTVGKGGNALTASLVGRCEPREAQFNRLTVSIAIHPRRSFANRPKILRFPDSTATTPTKAVLPETDLVGKWLTQSGETQIFYCASVVVGREA